MIKFNNFINEEPYINFKEKYDAAINANQKNIEAISISSFNREKNEVDSRFVNIKFIDKDKFIFFTNYNSPKSIAFASHNQISGLFFWQSINVQIRMKAYIKQTSVEFNNDYFRQRSTRKNFLAISSMQSKKISSYEDVLLNYQKTQEDTNPEECPNYWGGFSFVPYYFEFWEGHELRLNKRIVFEKIDVCWEKSIIQP